MNHQHPKDSDEFTAVCMAVVAYLNRYDLKETLKMLITMFETCIGSENIVLETPPKQADK